VTVLLSQYANALTNNLLVDGLHVAAVHISQSDLVYECLVSSGTPKTWEMVGYQALCMS